LATGLAALAAPGALHSDVTGASSRSMIPGRLLVPLLVLAGCATDDKQGWPSLSPRANEVSPLVPRVPLGACAACVPDATAPVAAPPPLLGIPEPLPLPADADAQMRAIEAAVADVEARWPAQRRDARAAIATATSDAESEAFVQASRFEALFLALGDTSSALEALEDALVYRTDQPNLSARARDLRQRLDRLESIRVAGLDR